MPRSKTLDSPAEVVYWTLTPGQRHTIATQLEVIGDADPPDECERAQQWLQRARARGSFAKLILLAIAAHRRDLRAIEETIRRFGYRRSYQEADAREAELMAELEEYRNRHYQWLQYGRMIVAEDRRERAFKMANERWPQPLAEQAS